jgi:hypothetical protein
VIVVLAAVKSRPYGSTLAPPEQGRRQSPRTSMRPSVGCSPFIWSSVRFVSRVRIANAPEAPPDPLEGVDKPRVNYYRDKRPGHLLCAPSFKDASTTSGTGGPAA